MRYKTKTSTFRFPSRRVLCFKSSSDKMGGPNHKPEPEVIDLTKDRENKDREAKLPVKKRRLEPESPPSASPAPPVLEKATFEIPETSLLESLNLRRAPRLEPEVPASSIVTTEATSTGQSRPPASDDKRVHHIYENGRKQVIRVVPQGTSGTINNDEMQKKIQRAVQAQKDAPGNQAKKKLSVPNPGNSPNSKPSPEAVGPEPGPSLSRRPRTQKQEFDLLIPEFKRNPNPTTTEYFAIEDKTGLSVTQLKQWWCKERRKMIEVGPSDSDFASTDGRAAGNFHSPTGPKPSTSTDVNSEHLPHINAIPTPKRKYIRDSSKRTRDLSIIQSDFTKVKQYDKTDLERILHKAWDQKANNLFIIATEREFWLKESLHKESRRLKELSSADLFSTQQYEAVLNWKKTFTAKKVREGHSEPVVQKVVDDIIMMWLEPYIYSKLTTQNGKFLTLSIGLRDFCKLRDNTAEFDWEIPIFLQHPLKTEGE